jgi:hypothetical protein
VDPGNGKWGRLESEGQGRQSSRRFRYAISLRKESIDGVGRR